jgi:hypothetical protein
MNAAAESLSAHRATVPPATPIPVAVDAGGDSAVAWGAIFAGAAVAAAMSLILLMLGTGFGLSSVSPWAFDGVSAATLGWSAIAWISFTSLFASGLGGYIAGRLRSRWHSLPGDETFFRDTAHGFLAWSVATLFTAALLTSAIGAILGAGVKAGATVAGAGASTAVVAGATGAAAVAGSTNEETDAVTSYFVDTLFRPDPNAPATRAPVVPASADSTDTIGAIETGAARRDNVAPAPDFAPVRAEAMRIVVNSLGTGTLNADDTRHLGHLIAERSGLTQQQAEARVTEVHARLQATIDEARGKTKEAADTARKAAARASLWLFITLLMGAFAASLLATYGGRQRDL